MEKIRVGMNEANISSKEVPIIGTDSLGPCIGVLIHSKKHKKAVVFHTSTEWKELVVQALILLAENEIISYDNLNKAIESLFLHDKYNLYEFDQKTKQGYTSSSTKPPQVLPRTCEEMSDCISLLYF